MNPDLVILAGGLSSRMSKAAGEKTKSMIGAGPF
jgi:molybdopterin-guanine dinucleotide biosynthesis protein A